MYLLVCNAGSTSLKFKLYEMPEERILCTGKVERVGSFDDAVISYRNEQTGAEEPLERCCIPSYTEGIAAFTEYRCDPSKGVVRSVEGIGAVGFKTVLAKGFYGVHFLTEEVLEGMRAYLSVAPADELYDSLRSAKEKRDLAQKTAAVVSRVTGLPKAERPGKPKREYLLR